MFLNSENDTKFTLHAFTQQIYII